MEKEKRKKSKKKIITLSTIGFIILLIILSNIFKGDKEPVITVQTEKVEKRDITQIVSATGKINPEYKVAITPEVTGEIVELPIKEGDSVKKAQLLIKIKPDTYIAQRDRARANLESTKATLKMKIAQLDLVKIDYKRTEKLFKSGISNKQEMDNIISNLASYKAQLDAQKAIVSQAKASLKEAEESLYKTSIYSPMNGTISKLNVELGERVLGSGFSQGTDIMTVADLSKMEAEVEVDENDVVLVSIGDKTKITLDAFNNKIFTGVVKQIANSAKTKGLGTQEEVVNFDIKISLEDFDKKIRPGMSCNADIETETKNNVLAVPIQSVTARSEKQEQEEDEKKDENFGTKKMKKKKSKPKEVVFIIENNVARMREVKIGISDDTYLEIKKGLNKGEIVVIGPYRAISKELKHDSKITIKKKKDTIKKEK